MAVDVNAFLDDDSNPFMDPEPTQLPAVMRDADGRRLRPNGEPYASDPSVRMSQMHEDGVMGPQFGHLGGGRTKRAKRAAEIVSETAAKHAKEIAQVFKDGIDPSMPIGVRIKTAETILGIEHKENELRLKEEAQDFEQMPKGELVDEIMKGLQALAEAKEALGLGEGDITDADVVED